MALDSLLFIGGPANGRRQEVATSMRVIRQAERLRVSSPSEMMSGTDPGERQVVNIGIYHRESIQMPGLEVDFWRWEGLSLEEAILMLFAGYPWEG